MYKQEPFQKPWQLALLDVHEAIIQIANFVAAPFVKLFDFKTRNFLQEWKRQNTRRLTILPPPPSY